MDNLHLYHELEALLRNDSKYCMDDGTLIKAKIVEDALNLQPDLLKYILSHSELKANFFSEVSETLVFDKVKFQQFVINKSFLPDSYTAYKNKIGLTDQEGRFISESREVVLAWPYKDCMLEGGQTIPEEEAEGWVDISETKVKANKNMFLVHAIGNSMAPKINDGDLCVFELYGEDNAGSREGEIVLTRCSGKDDDYECGYTIKEYHSKKAITNDDTWEHTSIQLKSLNPDYPSIDVSPEEAQELRTIGILKAVLNK